MFSNSNFKLAYNTMSNNDIESLDIGKLSDAGFCFMWVLNSTMDLGAKCMTRWGYEVINYIVWAKT